MKLTKMERRVLRAMAKDRGMGIVTCGNLRYRVGVNTEYGDPDFNFSMQTFLGLIDKRLVQQEKEQYSNVGIGYEITPAGRRALKEAK